MDKPNILYIHSHDTGRYIQPYGHAIDTPCLQHLAEDGVLFRQNFCINPTCSPSRAALLTGCYPHENGMTGLAHREWSLLPLVAGDVADLHDELFFEVNYHAAYEPMRAVRTKRWKYIKRFDGRRTPVLPNCDDGESKSSWLTHDWKHQSVPVEALFDLVFDPNETNNLVHDPAAQSILDDLRGRVVRWMKETDDPLLEGAVSAPPGAVIHNADGLSPQEATKPAQPSVPGDA